jgi:uncharacterized membrane protein
VINNTGNAACAITFDMEGAPDGWYAEFSEDGNASHGPYVMELNVSGESVLNVRVSTNSSSAPGDYSAVIVGDSVAGTSEYSGNVTLTMSLTLPPLEAWVVDDGQEVAAGSGTTVHLQINNTGDDDIALYVGTWDWEPYLEAVAPAEELAVPAGSNLTVAVDIVTWSSAAPGEKEVYVSITFMGTVVEEVTIHLTVV